MKLFDILGLALLGIAAVVPESNIEIWGSFAIAALLCFLLAFGLSVWDGTSEDVL